MLNKQNELIGSLTNKWMCMKMDHALGPVFLFCNIYKLNKLIWQLLLINPSNGLSLIISIQYDYIRQRRRTPNCIMFLSWYTCCKATTCWLLYYVSQLVRMLQGNMLSIKKIYGTCSRRVKHNTSAIVSMP